MIITRKQNYWLVTRNTPLGQKRVHITTPEVVLTIIHNWKGSIHIR